MDSDFKALAARIQRAERLTILTGAGVSAASGVPTFRGQEGLWREYRPADLATPQAFGRNPLLVWEWYVWRRERLATCRPNAAHDVIASWSQRPGCRVVTQNVDDLHLRAGTRSLTRIHGSIWELSCWESCAQGAIPWRDDSVTFQSLPPRCPYCGGTARPAVVWFGEALRAQDLRAALDATACDLFMTVGTSAVVYPAAGLVHEARRRGAFTVEINLEATPSSGEVDLAILGAAEDVLPRVASLMNAAR
jgi:NAD-dependent deacetylase